MGRLSFVMEGAENFEITPATKPQCLACMGTSMLCHDHYGVRAAGDLGRM
jgi:hypothetical protein